MPATAIDESRVANLRHAYEEVAKARPSARIRDVADELGVSEAELVMTEVDGAARRLSGDWGKLLQRLPALGPVMTLTRNPHCVHEKVGRFEDVQVMPGHGGIGLVLGADIDLRIFLRHWRTGFAVAKATNDGVRNSLQFFDESGTAVFKLFLRPESDLAAYRALVEDYAAKDPEAIEIVPPPARKAPRPDAEIDVPGLREAWRALKDTHDFVPMLMKRKVERLQALRLAGHDLAAEVPNGSLRRTLEWAQGSGAEIMVFVGNRGCIQIHTGPVKTVKAMGPWFNVLDPGFNLHLREDRIVSAWVVRKPTEDGTITSLELFDAEGELIATLFGKRKPGQPEREDWRNFAEKLAAESVPA
ncbi:MAG: hemin-degrading factor [Rhodospirillaceae bacterium]|nr:hemin-degrading factor [Rhodospirillaceae bacterium]